MTGMEGRRVVGRDGKIRELFPVRFEFGPGPGGRSAGGGEKLPNAPAHMTHRRFAR